MNKYDKFFNENMSEREALAVFCALTDEAKSDQDKKDLIEAHRKNDKKIFDKISELAEKEIYY
jgi:hypothetical protein